MNYRIFIVLVIIALFLPPLGLGQFDDCHHGDDLADHDGRSCDCGCLCHISTNAIPRAEIIETNVVSSITEVFFLHPKLDTPTYSLDRPPELHS
ncbi:MAG: hypothetical protein ACOZB3_03470 [Calditrichota bacterium]